MKMMLILATVCAVVLSGCDSKEDTEVKALLKRAKTSESPHAQSSEKENPSRLDFHFSIIEAVGAVKDVHVCEGRVQRTRNRLTEESLPSYVELASVEYQDAKEALEKAKADYEKADALIGETAPDHQTYMEATAGIRAYRVEYSKCRLNVVLARTGHSSGGKVSHDSVRIAEAAFEALKDRAYEDIVPMLRR